MPSLDLIDHSPQHPTPVDPLPNATKLILIDNYDSFTWNVYQYLVLEGATVTVYRNDKVSLQELIDQHPSQLVISPGPGHPDKDGGISQEAIKYFGGRIPVLGVCMGEQCMYSVYGGKVDVTGEILHGKTSLLKHDGKGVYEGLRQDLPVTRYHSLAGTHLTLPECLEVSSSIAANPNGGKEVIMGVRHKKFIVEGVQFHPESILTEEGRVMLKNFLRFKGGTWEENSQSKDTTRDNKSPKGPHSLDGSAINGNQAASGTQNGKVSILEKIFDHRKVLVAEQKQIPSQRPSDLQAAYDMHLAPPQISFTDRLRQSPYSLSLMAEIKRASPSKGIIAIDTCAPQQARTYALAGASVISVLTEPNWFKGSIEDLRSVRQSLEGMTNRPVVLRKEFIFEEYQILEARLAGADTVLLIVKMLEKNQLHRLYQYSLSLGMEPLVEVQNEEEMVVAKELNAQVIGVNNRNLVTFDVDLDTTSRLMKNKPPNSILCALSGISSPEDVVPYQKSGVGAVLVGEALMRAKDTTKFVQDLLGGGLPTPHLPEVLVKICGTRTPAMAKAAIEAGADMIGMILVEGRRRFVPEDTAMAISEVVHNTLKDRQTLTRSSKTSQTASDFFSHTSRHHFSSRHRALLVGVFQNQSLSHVLEQQRLLDLDVVQFHGSEPIEWARFIPVPVIHSFKPGDKDLAKRGYHAITLLDAGSGGTGQSLEKSGLEATLSQDSELRIFLAGGLDPENIVEKMESLGLLNKQVVGLDVSSGVESDGEQDSNKIHAFVKAAKSIQR